MKTQLPCPCNSGDPYASCCEPVLSGKLPDSAEQLMRSRYTAFTQDNEAYLLRSWHHSTRPKALNLDNEKHIKWVNLKVLRHESKETSAIVEFIAHYKINGKAEKIHELSRFTKEGDRWFYVDGDQY
jgi:SEC-C motif-containing protein